MMAWFWTITLLTTTATAVSTNDGPCDIYARGNTPCVAAHSLTRALYAEYAGPLYSVRKPPSGATKDIFVLRAGGAANTTAHDAFCGTPSTSSTCVVQRIFDQSLRGNHLGIEHGAPNLSPPRNIQDAGVNFTDPRSQARLGSDRVHW